MNAMPVPETTVAAPVLEMRGISKAFPGVRALSDVALELRPGRVTALIGENGAGKSTLVKILTGIHRPDAGEILIDGAPCVLPTAEAAQAAGITAIHQETVLFDDLTVAENIFLGHAPKNRLGLVAWGAMNARAAALLYSIDAAIDPRTRLKDLSIAQRHLVAIARALSVDARIVIMDEPTAALSHKEVEDLFRIIERLKSRGKAILFISHKFEELRRIADDYAVFRDGRRVGAGRLADVSHADLVRMMVGREVTQVFPKREVAIGPTVLSVAGYRHPTEFDGISLELRRGEILGLYGLVGAGRSEFCQALFGVTRPSGGTVALDGRTLTIRSPADAIAAGIVYVPEERGRHGAITAMPIVENISLPSLARTARRGFLRSAEEFALARTYAARLDLRAASLSQPVGTLSGGNQQKVVIGKWLATRPKVIVLDEPTKGIDIGSKAAVHAFMGELAAEGLAVLMVSSEIPEILGMSDRVVVMKEGRMVATYDRAGLTPEILVAAATGNAEAAP
ncbi:sugar ABC transporter ATP-binding protein [Oharaeibacter diazotrophicus]|uniref:Rhamnose ABC transporter ATP-binding protein n=1 Tax=Oharaeibacter diazotrophicus TaxID=1920512 RepID=A0A4V3CWG8_9HYPH|nr:sugar ABC transporter ATP-binding protein [Oharaeibacter diazotrophicus]TDP86318.1 rhamnose ABC transporter ATP-binding protein [Oharaeibacter diazotrophicus]BBE71739.1 ribose import ATP-binding protein RbsA [Pleomorphomonas sp. SM30]GLS78505.1 ribose import ATP-binding protein RbsA 1 [Oharaeibacter diazotrophicus]